MIIGVLCLVLLPLDYRAGASTSHPHSILQLLYDLSHGSLVHHDAAAAGEIHPNETHDHPAPPRSDLLATEPPNAGASRRVPALSPATVISALTSLVSNPGLAGDTGDEPEQAPRSVPGKYAVYSLALPVAAMQEWHWSGRRLLTLPAPVWSGLTLAPEPPPPRVVAIAYPLLLDGAG